MRWLAYHLSRLACKSLLAPFVRAQVFQPETTSIPGAWILAPNHISHFDPPIIGVAARRKVDWMAMTELFENPVTRCWLRSIDAFPVNRAKVDRAALRAALQRLGRGHIVGIFPEGGIRAGEESVLAGAQTRPGVGAIAQMAEVPVVPCVVVGSDRLYGYNSWNPLNRTRIYIGFGQQLRCPRSGRDARVAFEAQLEDAIRDLFYQMRDRYRLTTDDFPKHAKHRQGNGG